MDTKFYETEISDFKWIAYDIPGNVGWIIYIASLILTFLNKSDFLLDDAFLIIMIISIFPAILMIIGIFELISERIQKLDRILPYNRLLRGFGFLSYGGLLGVILTGIGLAYAFISVNGYNLFYLTLMFLGSVLCAVFAWLIYRTFHPKI